MKHCPNPECPFLARMGEVAEYQDHVETCVDCGAALVAGEAPTEPPAATPPQQMGSPLVVVATFLRTMEANLWRARLEAEGIPAFVADEATSTWYGSWGDVLGSVRLMVPESRAEQARQILEERSNQQGEP